ncbi:MAG TPA: glycoside hydrolase family 95 protein, partial [bacterium]|nr:glycoside hydrolase family 95 protein [bacterium]
MQRREFLKLMTTGTLSASLIPGIVNAQNIGESARSRLRLWYTGPAERWVEALPVGNGRLGAMVFGRTAEERIQLNEDTLWAGEPHDYAHNGAYKYLPEIRRLLFDGRQSEAEELAMEEFMSVPLRQMPYQPMGDIRLHLPGHEQPETYERELDIERAIASVKYIVDSTRFTREIFASAPHDVIVVRLTADTEGALNFQAGLESPHENTSTASVGDNQFILQGSLDRFYYEQLDRNMECVLDFETRVLVTHEGGQKRVTDEGIRVEQADSATLILAAATNYTDYKQVDGDPQHRCSRVIESIKGLPYQSLKQAHIRDYQELFGRVTLDLGTTSATELPTDQRVLQFAANRDPQLIALYFQYGRYLLISSSRPGSQPANLQGLWNREIHPPWECKYTTNINAEMNYWPAELTNLPECHLPLFDMLEEAAESGRTTAREHYNCRGWVLHHNTDLWRGTAPINHSNHGIWPTGGAWLCQHFWWHYVYSGDQEFLANRAYPIMKDAALFFLDFLVEDPETGWLISVPSNSPEQGGLVAGPTMDHQIIRNLFGNTIKASRILDVDTGLRRTLEEKREKIAPNQIGQYGQLKEWAGEEMVDPYNQHRHVSHLWGLHPGDEIIPEDTPDLAGAARQTLEFRGDGGTGW